MDDPLLVRGFERLGDLGRDGERFVDGKRAARDALVQALAVDELEDEEQCPPRFLDAVDGADVRVVQRRETWPRGETWRADRD